MPEITFLSHTGTVVGSPTMVIAVLGTAFEGRVSVRWNGQDLPTASLSPTLLLTEIAASRLTTAGTAQITVFTSTGGTSNTIIFSIRSVEETPGSIFAPYSYVSMNPLPSTAEIVYLDTVYPEGKQVFAMDRSGQNAVQITLSNPRDYDQVAISRDRRFLAAAETFGVMRPPKLWIFDLEKKTETQVGPRWLSAGFGGIDWDANGFLYFGGIGYNLWEGGTSNFNDLYRVKYDGTGLQRLIRTDDNNEGDVDVSDDSTKIAFTREHLVGMPESYTEIWAADPDGRNSRLVVAGGVMGVASVQNPAFSPDGTKIAFDRRNDNPEIPPNFASDNAANGAHDLWIVKASGGAIPPEPTDPENPTNVDNASGYAVRLTREGPISILPSWKSFTTGTVQGSLLLYLQVCECQTTGNPYGGTAIVYETPAGTQEPIRIKARARGARWIP